MLLSLLLLSLLLFIYEVNYIESVEHEVVVDELLIVCEPRSSEVVVDELLIVCEPRSSSSLHCNN